MTFRPILLYITCVKPRAISYIRWSSPEQAKGDSLRRQLSATKAYCTKHGLILDEEFRDEGISGFSGRNAETGALSRFLASVKSGQVPNGSVLIVESLDRLSRDEILPAFNIFLSLLMAGIKLVTLGDGREYTYESVNKNPMELQFSIMELTRSRRESERKSELIGPAWAQKKRQAKQGTIVTRRVPAWVRVVGDRLKLDPLRSKTVQRIVQLATDGDGAMAIAQLLNREGVPNISTSGKPWCTGTIRKIISNPALTGVYQPMTRRGKQPRQRDGAPVPNYFPRVINDDAWHRLRAAQERRRTHIRGRAGASSVPNLFGSLLRCGDDGSVFLLSRKRKGRTLITCSHGEHGLGERHTCCYDEFEEEFLAFIDTADLQLRPQPKLNNQVLEKQLVQLQSSKLRVEEEIAKGGSLAQMDTLLALIRRLADNESRLRSRNDETRRTAVSPNKEDLEALSAEVRLRVLTGEARRRERVRIRDRIGATIESIEVFIREDDRGVRRTCLTFVKFREGIKTLRGNNTEHFGWKEFPYRGDGAVIPIGGCHLNRQEVVKCINSKKWRDSIGADYYDHMRRKKVSIPFQEWADQNRGNKK